MARFFFQIDDGTFNPDLEGTEFPSVAAAQYDAVRYAGQLINDHAGKFWNTGEWNMTVTSDTGLSLFTLQVVGTPSPSIRAIPPSHQA